MWLPGLETTVVLVLSIEGDFRLGCKSVVTKRGLHSPVSCVLLFTVLHTAFAYCRCVSTHHEARQCGGEMCYVPSAHTLETRVRQHISSMCSTFSYMEDSVS